MREFGFRICYTDQIGGKYIIYHNKEKPFCHFILLNGGIIEDYGKGIYEVPFDCAEPAFLQQYTGMKDVNGKDIYEGDIIKYEQNISYEGMKYIHKYSEVYFLNGCFRIKPNRLINGGIGGVNEYLFEVADFCSIAGNVFENKNLLD